MSTMAMVEGTGYLILKKDSRNSYKLRMRYTILKPALASDEIAVKLAVKIPRDAFMTAVVEITIPTDQIITPTVVVADQPEFDMHEVELIEVNR